MEIYDSGKVKQTKQNHKEQIIQIVKYNVCRLTRDEVIYST